MIRRPTTPKPSPAPSSPVDGADPASDADIRGRATLEEMQVSWKGTPADKCDCICGCSNDAKKDEAVCSVCFNGSCTN